MYRYINSSWNNALLEENASDKLKKKYPKKALLETKNGKYTLYGILDLLEQSRAKKQGPESVGEEVADAMYHILWWGDYGDGYVFYEGEGKKNCLNYVAYICDMFPWTYDKFAKIANSELRGDEYVQAITQISEQVCDELLDDKIELFWTPSQAKSKNLYWTDKLKQPFHEPT
jgi:hypothetical protein